MALKFLFYLPTETGLPASCFLLLTKREIHCIQKSIQSKWHCLENRSGYCLKLQLTVASSFTTLNKTAASLLVRSSFNFDNPFNLSSLTSAGTPKGRKMSYQQRNYRKGHRPNKSSDEACHKYKT